MRWIRRGRRLRRPTPASEITPGVRWQRGDQFPDEPDVGALYETLIRDGIIVFDGENRPATGRGYHQDVIALLKRVRALGRRAAEDGFRAEFMPLTRRWNAQYCLRLEGPTRAEDFDPRPEIHETAAKLYRAAARSRRPVLLTSNYSTHAFTGVMIWDAVIDELKRLASADGRRLAVRTWQEFGCRVKLERSS